MGAGGMTQTSAALVKALEAGSGRYRWVAAVSGSQSAATLELATGGDPVMAIGGFNGEGGHLSLAQFKRYVAAGDIHYYIASTGGGAGAPGMTGAGRTPWASSTAGGSTNAAGGPPSRMGGSGAAAAAGGPPSGGTPGTSGSASGATGAPAGDTGSAAGAAGAGRLGAGGLGTGGLGAGRLGAGAGGPGGYSASSITSWVKAHYKTVTIGGQTVYDLQTPK
jgi:hypothetical protein